MTFSTTIIDQVAGLSPRLIARYTAALATLTAATEAGEISNVSYGDVKDALNWTFDEAWGVIHNYESGDLCCLNPTCHTLASVQKRLAKAPSDTPHLVALQAFIVEIAPVAAALNGLKDKIVKRQPKAPEDVTAKYLAPRASDSAAKLVQDALLQVVADTYDRLLANITAGYEGYVTTYLKLRAEALAKNPKLTGYRLSPYKLFCPYVQQAKHIASLATDSASELYPDWQARVAKEAKKDADFLRDQFVIKNLRKLDSIVEAKGNLTAVTVSSYRLDLCSLEGTLLVTFADGSLFTARNSVVWGTSNLGNSFQRFPLTFHDVKLADGSKMGKPCEERMNTVFVGKAE